MENKSIEVLKDAILKAFIASAGLFFTELGRNLTSTAKLEQFKIGSGE